MKHFLRLRAAILVYLTHRLALPVLVLVRNPQPFGYTHDDLRTLPAHTTGAALLHFLEGYGLHLLRHYERHDLKHLLTGYPPTDGGEVCLQTFMLATGHTSFPVLITVCFGVLFMPDHWSAMRAAWMRGRRTPSLEGVHWPSLIKRPLQEVRAELCLA
jgi:hypothetical protein